MLAIQLYKRFLHTFFLGRTFNELNSTLEIDHQDSPPKQCLTSSSQSSVMHTYANPFQSGCGGSSFSEDTTGPIIPDISTLRPSQVRVMLCNEKL